jgi:molybdopterin molybdotransferase
MGPWKIIGRSAPGDRRRRLPRLQNDTAVEVLTGAPLPSGANAVLRVEGIRRKGNRIWADRPVRIGRDVARRGEDFRPGETIVDIGVRIRPWHVAALIANDIRKVPVFASLRVGLLTTGTEVVPATRPARVGAVRDTTKPLLQGMLAELGLRAVDLGHVPDNESAIRRAVSNGIRRCDLLITVGGSSVGRRDLVPRVLGRSGRTTWIARGVGLRPGSTTAVAAIRDRPVFVLPGPPVAAFSAFQALVEPLLRSRGDTVPPTWPTVTARLNHGIRHSSGIRELLRVRIRRRRGFDRVVSISRHGAARLSSLTGADGLLVLDERRGDYAAGEAVEVFLLRDRTEPRRFQGG